MRLGISSYTYGWNVGLPGKIPAKPFNELDLVQRAAGFSVPILQIGDNLPLHEFDETRLQVFVDALKQNQLQLEIGARGMTGENLNCYILLAAQTGARLLRFVIDSSGYEPPVHEIVNVILKYESLLKKYDITLALENHDRFGAAELAGIIELVNSRNVGICLDTVNSIGAGESIETVIAALAPYAVNLHIKDFRIKRLSYKMGFIVEGSIAGEGMLDIPALLQKIKNYKKCRSAILEQWVIPGNDIENTIVKEEQWAKESMQYLQSVEEWK